MNSKTLLILPYFGRFKNYFQLFLLSFSYNTNFDLLIFTDQNMLEYSIPSNVFVKKIKFDEFKKIIQSHFDFPICLSAPYKLCDFKPSYGYLFQDCADFQKYQYWGYCDCDLIFGNLIPVLELEKKGYLKIFANGHLTLYKNTPENNSVFMLPLQGRYVYKEAFTTDRIYGFDEGGDNYLGELLSVHEIFLHYFSNSTYSNDISFNASTAFDRLHNCQYLEIKKGWECDKKSVVLHFAHGNLFSNNKEYIYCHLQGRKMKILCKSFESFDISSYAFINANNIFQTIASNFFFSLKPVRRLLQKLRRKSNFSRK